MILHDKSTSADIALHTYTDANRRAADALMTDVAPAETQVYPPCATDVYPRQDFDGGMLRRLHDPDRQARRAGIFIAALITCVVGAALLAARLF